MNLSLSSSSSSPSFPSASAAASSTTASASWFSGIVRGRSDRAGGAKMSDNNSSAGFAGGESASGPIKGKNQFRGVLFKYGPMPIQVAFKTGDYKQQVIFIGGLTDGFLATEYLEPLAIALDKERWSLVQLLLSSSYGGYGTSSLQQWFTEKIVVGSPVMADSFIWEAQMSIEFYVQDAKELDQLISYLINKENSEGVVLLGHSTGCQDIVHYMRTNAACSRAVRAAILQAPVSDREYRATLPETAAMIDLASRMIAEGRGSELMPKEADPSAPISAYRWAQFFVGSNKKRNLDPFRDAWYHSLCSYMGDDDMFSSDLSDDQLRMRLGHMCNTPCQVVFSMADEYVPEYVDKKALVERLCRAMGGAEKVEIEHGNHSLSNRVGEAVQAIVDFVKREGPTGWDDPWN